MLKFKCQFEVLLWDYFLIDFEEWEEDEDEWDCEKDKRCELKKFK